METEQLELELWAKLSILFTTIKPDSLKITEILTEVQNLEERNKELKEAIIKAYFAEDRQDTDTALLTVMKDERFEFNKDLNKKLK